MNIQKYINYTAVIRTLNSCKGFTILYNEHELPEYTIGEIFPYICIDSIKNGYVKEVLPADEVIRVSLYSVAKNGFYTIKVSQLEELTLSPGSTIKLDLRRPVASSPDSPTSVIQTLQPGDIEDIILHQKKTRAPFAEISQENHITTPVLAKGAARPGLLEFYQRQLTERQNQISDLTTALQDTIPKSKHEESQSKLRDLGVLVEDLERTLAVTTQSLAQVTAENKALRLDQNHWESRVSCSEERCVCLSGQLAVTQQILSETRDNLLSATLSNALMEAEEKAVRELLAEAISWSPSNDAQQAAAGEVDGKSSSEGAPAMEAEGSEGLECSMPSMQASVVALLDQLRSQMSTISGLEKTVAKGLLQREEVTSQLHTVRADLEAKTSRLEEEKARLEEKLNERIERIQEMEQILIDSDNTINDMNTGKIDMEMELESLRSENLNLREEVEVLRAENSNLRDQISNLTEKNVKLTEELMTEREATAGWESYCMNLQKQLNSTVDHVASLKTTVTDANHKKTVVEGELMAVKHRVVEKEECLSRMRGEWEGECAWFSEELKCIQLRLGEAERVIVEKEGRIRELQEQLERNVHNSEEQIRTLQLQLPEAILEAASEGSLLTMRASEARDELLSSEAEISKMSVAITDLRTQLELTVEALREANARRCEWEAKYLRNEDELVKVKESLRRSIQANDDLKNISGGHKALHQQNKENETCLQCLLGDGGLSVDSPVNYHDFPYHQNEGKITNKQINDLVVENKELKSQNADLLRQFTDLDRKSQRVIRDLRRSCEDSQLVCTDLRNTLAVTDERLDETVTQLAFMNNSKRALAVELEDMKRQLGGVLWAIKEVVDMASGSKEESVTQMVTEGLLSIVNQHYIV